MMKSKSEKNIQTIFCFYKFKIILKKHNHLNISNISIINYKFRNIKDKFE